MLQYIPKTHAKYLIRARAPTPLNDIQKFRDFAHFSAKYIKFQIFLELSIFIVHGRLVYEKASIFDEEYDGIKIKRFT